MKVSRIPDSTSNTIFVVEAGQPVPWTKPADIPYSNEGPMPRLGGIFPDVFWAALGDGSIRRIQKGSLTDQTLRRAITANDGLPLGDDWNQ